MYHLNLDNLIRGQSEKWTIQNYDCVGWLDCRTGKYMNARDIAAWKLIFCVRWLHEHVFHPQAMFHDWRIVHISNWRDSIHSRATIVNCDVLTRGHVQSKISVNLIFHATETGHWLERIVATVIPSTPFNNRNIVLPFVFGTKTVSFRFAVSSAIAK